MSRHRGALSQLHCSNDLDDGDDGDSINSQHDTCKKDLSCALAANLSAVFPKTPQRIAQNSGRKRRPVADLSRPSPSPGHGASMTMMFRDASASLQAIQTPPRRALSTAKASRLPTSQDRSVRFGHSGHVGHNDRTLEPHKATPSKVPDIQTSPADFKLARTRSSTSCTDCQPQTLSRVNVDRGIDDSAANCLPTLPDHESAKTPSHATSPLKKTCLEDHGKEPISSGFATPSGAYNKAAKTPEEIIYPDFGHWRLPPSSSVEGSLVLSSPIAEETQSAKIASWLHSLPKPSEADDPIPIPKQGPPTDSVHVTVFTPSQKAFRNRSKTPQSHSAASKLAESQQTHSRASSNKENVSPSKLTPPPVRSRIPQAITPSKFCSPKLQASAEIPTTLPVTHLLTPHGHLSLPPKRKKFRLGGEVKHDPPKSASKDFTIHDDQVEDALAQLSPDVELRRKGRRPKKDRCVSYWDEDILPSGSSYLPGKTEASSVPMRKGKVILGESQQTAHLTKEKPFAVEAENAEFDFHV